MINPAKMVGFMLTYNATKIRSSELKNGIVDKRKIGEMTIKGKP